MFLVGSERSGTTLLRLMLDHHPEIAFEKEFDFVVAKVTDAGALPRWTTTSSGSPPFAARTMRSTVARLSALVNDFLRQKQAASGGKPHVGATVHRNFDRSRFSGRTLAISTSYAIRATCRARWCRKGWAGNIYQASEFWIQAENCWDSLVPQLSAVRSRNPL